MIQNVLILSCLLPLAAGVAVLVLPRGLCRLIAAAATLLNLGLAAFMFRKEAMFAIPWAPAGIEFSMRLYHFSGFIILAAAVFSLLIAIYSVSFLRNNPIAKQFFAYLLISISFVNGAVLADNLVLLLFFWEGLLGLMFGFIAIGGKQSFKTATKAFIIVGVCDLCMMAGIILAGHVSGTLAISKMHIPLNLLGGVSFILLAIGAVSKGGSMPFHTWIPDAAVDAPLPFMAFFPGAIEKLLGIYFLTRITLDMFQLKPDSAMSTVLMTLGAITIVLAVMMALVQKDYKKLLSYHAISQLGYMILGIGTCLPAGIIGGIFHMLNNAIYKSCLFLTGGAVENQTGSTNLEKLGGLGAAMPVTFLCFFICAASISGVPPFNGFVSKELVYGAAMSRGMIFYLAAIIGSFLTAASFLKLGHAAFLGKARQTYPQAREVSVSMLLPMIVLAALCIIFGVFKSWPLDNLIGPVLGEAGGHHVEAENPTLVLITAAVLFAALIHHITAVQITGDSVRAADHIHYAPVLSSFYGWAEKRYFDLYEIGRRIIGGIALLLWSVDKAIDWVYNVLAVGLTKSLSRDIRWLQAGYYVIYIVWALLGSFMVLIISLH